MKGVYSVFTEYRSEKLIERSRFISTCLHVESEEEARAFLARVRTEFPRRDAPLLCVRRGYARQSHGGFPDDGEPRARRGMAHSGRSARQKTLSDGRRRHPLFRRRETGRGWSCARLFGRRVRVPGRSGKAVFRAVRALYADVGLRTFGRPSENIFRRTAGRSPTRSIPTACA